MVLSNIVLAMIALTMAVILMRENEATYGKKKRNK